MVISRRRIRAYLWVANSTRKRQKIAFGMDTKMKTFLSLVTCICFLFSTIAGASMQTLMEIGIEQDNIHLVATELVAMPIKQLTEVEI